MSGGVEWNIPHHHRASSQLPVDYRMVDNADGSKTLWIGETELRHRLKWEVGLTLFPDKSYIYRGHCQYIQSDTLYPIIPLLGKCIGTL